MSDAIAMPNVGQWVTLACLLEATAPKPGNVHRGADFEDATYLDFAVSAVAIGPPIDRCAAQRRVGLAVLEAVRAMRAVSATNTYLGAILLLAPLAAVPSDRSIEAGIGEVLAALDEEDARQVYEAIRLAQPGGLGRVDEADVHGEAPSGLLAAMRLAADRDLVARQYAGGFREVLQVAASTIRDGVGRGWPVADAIVHAHLRLMSEHPDSLIARKCGPAVAQQAARWAASILAAGGPEEAAYRAGLADLDFWLRADGNRRNPGTTADLIAAGLFVLLRERLLAPPLRFYGSERPVSDG